MGVISGDFRTAPQVHSQVLDPVAMQVASETPTSQGAVTRTAVVSRQTSPTGSACRDATAAAAEAAAATAFGAAPGGGGGGGGGSSRADSRGGAAAWAAMLNGTSTCRSMPVVVCRGSSAAYASEQTSISVVIAAYLCPQRSPEHTYHVLRP